MAESLDHITCEELVELVTEYHEQALVSHEASLFEQHLNFCDGCVLYVNQLRTTVMLTGRLAEDDVPPEVRDKLMTAFRNWRGA